MLVICLGDKAIKIAEKFNQYPQYKIYKVISNFSNLLVKKEKHLICTKQNYTNPEEYENNFQLKHFKFLEKYNKEKQEILVVVSGGDLFSAIILKMLEIVKNAKITIMFLISDFGKTKNKNKTNQRIVCGVLQEYARSGVFKEIILIDEKKIKQILGKVTVYDFSEKSAEIVVSFYHMINVLKNSSPVYGHNKECGVAERITTFGAASVETLDDEVFFNLNSVTNKLYYFYLNKNKLMSDTTILDKIDSKLNGAVETTNVSCSVYSSDFENDYIYIEYKTTIPQEIDF